MRKHTPTFSAFLKKAANIQINHSLDSSTHAPFFDEKMERGKKILAVAGLPKVK